MFRTLVIALLGLGGACSWHAAAASDQLVTGTATYDLSLDRTKSPGTIADVSGRAVYTVRLRCRTYEIESDLTADIVNAAGNPISFQLRSRHVEDDNSLEFSVAGTLAGVEIDRAAGTATRTAEGVTVALSAPSKKTVGLKGSFLFPVGMIKGALDAAKSGQTFAQFTVFNGGGHGEGILLVSAIVGSSQLVAQTPDEKDIAEALGFGGLRRWPMKFSYFPGQSAGDQGPVFISEGIIFENGSSIAATYDYGGGFAMQLKFADFTPIPPTPCP